VPDLSPERPIPLVPGAATTLEWPRLRSLIAAGCSSPLGRAWVESLEPTADRAWIEQQQLRTAELRTLRSGGVRFVFTGLFDPSDPLERARIEGAALDPIEIAALLELAERIQAWRTLVLPKPGSAPTPVRTGALPAIAALSSPLAEFDFTPLLNQLRGKIEPDGSLADDASPELRRIRASMQRQHKAIEDSLRRSLRALSTDGSTQDTLITVRGERFVIPVKAEFKRRVPGVIHGSSSSGQTVFVEPLEAIEQNNELVRLLDEEQAEIHRILLAFTRTLAQHAPGLLTGTAILAEVESHDARARFADFLHCVQPEFLSEAVLNTQRPPRPADAPVSFDNLTEGGALELRGARHPLLELRMREEAASQSATRTPDQATPTAEAATTPSTPPHLLPPQPARSAAPVPLTLILPNNARQLIVSGPNTGGKTVSLKTLGLLAIMAQAGLPIPADRAILPIFDAIYADIGDAQSIERNLSSFSAHVVNLDRILRTAQPGSLVLLDELGSATDPEEGAALAVAIAERFLALGCWSAVTTHLTAMKVYAANHAGVLNAAVGFDPEALAPTYTLRLGVPGASAGLNIASRLGMDPDLIASARTQMSTQTVDIGNFLDSLHTQLTAASAERDRLRLATAEVARERTRLQQEGRAEQKQSTRALEVKLQTLLREFEQQIKETVQSIDDKAVARRISRDAATRLNRLRRETGEQFQSTVLAHQTIADQNQPNAQTTPTGSSAGSQPSALQAHRPIAPGDLIHLRSLDREARVERILDSGYEVSFGTMKMRVPISDIAPLSTIQRPTPLAAARRRGGVTVQISSDTDSEYTPMEINVIGRTADEAHTEVERFLDRAFLAGLPRIRIVHGTGAGVLRRTLREYLRNHPHVANIEDPPQNLGGQGATEVELRQ
jgi:DNA mismatch repair protein MutS2